MTNQNKQKLQKVCLESSTTLLIESQSNRHLEMTNCNNETQSQEIHTFYVIAYHQNEVVLGSNVITYRNNINGCKIIIFLTLVNKRRPHPLV